MNLTSDGEVAKSHCRNTYRVIDIFVAILEKYNLPHICSVSDKAKQMPPNKSKTLERHRQVKTRGRGAGEVKGKHQGPEMEHSRQNQKKQEGQHGLRSQLAMWREETGRGSAERDMPSSRRLLF